MKIGMEFSKTMMVEKQHTALHVGSGIVEVLATPIMIALMEGASAQCVQHCMKDTDTTVGTMIQTTHLSATPIGMEVTATAIILKIEGKKIDFSVVAKDGRGIIGEGIHSRFIVNIEKFHVKAQEKKSNL